MKYIYIDIPKERFIYSGIKQIEVDDISEIVVVSLEMGMFLTILGESAREFIKSFYSDVNIIDLTDYPRGDVEIYSSRGENLRETNE